MAGLEDAGRIWPMRAELALAATAAVRIAARIFCTSAVITPRRSAGRGWQCSLRDVLCRFLTPLRQQRATPSQSTQARKDPDARFVAQSPKS